jgi:hypothetical protein
MRTRLVLALTLTLAPAAASGQAPSLAPGASDPGHTMTRAAGMPLNDGSLAPGMLTVRIVRGDFSNNVPDQDVTVTLDGGKVERARTGSDGRAQFAHLPVGARVRAAAVVDGERLESDTFPVPAESGVRLLLVVGDGPVTATGPAPGSVPPTAAAGAGAMTASVPAAPAVEPVPAGTPAAEGGTDTILVIRVVLASLTVLAIALLFARRRASGAGDDAGIE